jgi:hypothetical protein
MTVNQLMAELMDLNPNAEIVFQTDKEKSLKNILKIEIYTDFYESSRSYVILIGDWYGLLKLDDPTTKEV